MRVSRLVMGVRMAVGLLCLSSMMPENVIAQDEDARDRALVYFRGARDAYEAGEFQRSVVMLEEAVELHDIASLHYNLARALQELGRWQEARDEYTIFLEMDPDTQERGRVEARIVVLNETLRQEEPAEEGPSPPVDVSRPLELEAPAADGPRQPLPWIVFGTGAALIGGGAVAGGLSRASVQDIREAADHQSALVIGQTAQRRANIANALFVSGAVVCVTGLIWGLVAKRKPRVEVDVGASTIQLRGRF